MLCDSDVREYIVSHDNGKFPKASKGGEKYNDVRVHVMRAGLKKTIGLVRFVRPSKQTAFCSCCVMQVVQNRPLPSKDAGKGRLD